MIQNDWLVRVDGHSTRYFIKEWNRFASLADVDGVVQAAALHVGEDSGTTHEGPHGDGGSRHSTDVVSRSSAAGDSAELRGSLVDLGLNSLASGAGGVRKIRAERGQAVLDGAGGPGKVAGVNGLGLGFSAGSGLRSIGGGGVGVSNGVDAGREVTSSGREILNPGGDVGGDITSTAGGLADNGRNVTLGEERERERLGL
jgi:hypothetical protein